MTRKRKRRSSVLEIGNGPARVRIYTMNRKDGYPEFTLSCVSGNIADVTVADSNRFLDGLKKLGPVSKNGIRRNIVTMFGFAKRNSPIAGEDWIARTLFGGKTHDGQSV